jgi:hypothetical protein
MGTSRGISGGGYESRQVKHVSAPKREPISSSISVGAVSRLGSAQGPGTVFKPLYKGAGFSTVSVKPATGQGPGSNHAVYRSGSQSQHSSGGPAGSDFFKKQR